MQTMGNVFGAGVFVNSCTLTVLATVFFGWCGFLPCGHTNSSWKWQWYLY